MRIFTLASIGLSAVLAAGALFAARSFAPPQRGSDSAQEPARQVVVAKTALRYGDRLTRGKLALVQLPQSATPAGAYSRIDDVVGGAGAVAITGIAANEALLPDKIASGARASLAAAIADGYRAYTVRVTDVSGGGGHILAGDHVDVLLTRDEEGTTDMRRKRSDTLIQDVRVLGMDLQADPAAKEKAPPKTATLEVRPEDAARLAVAGEAGALSLSLRPAGAIEKAVLPTVRVSDLHGGEMPREGAVVRRPAPFRPVVRPDRGSPLVIIQGADRAEVYAPVMTGSGT